MAGALNPAGHQDTRAPEERRRPRGRRRREPRRDAASISASRSMPRRWVSRPASRSTNASSSMTMRKFRLVMPAAMGVTSARGRPLGDRGDRRGERRDPGQPLTPADATPLFIRWSSMGSEPDHPNVHGCTNLTECTRCGLTCGSSSLHSVDHDERHALRRHAASTGTYLVGAAGPGARTRAHTPRIPRGFFYPRRRRAGASGPRKEPAMRYEFERGDHRVASVLWEVPAR